MVDPLKITPVLGSGERMPTDPNLRIMREIRNDVQMLIQLRENDQIQHRNDMSGAIRLFDENTKAVKALEEKLTPFFKARAEFIVVKKWFTIGLGSLVAIIGTLYAAVTGVLKLVQMKRP